jgi:hypothetical protein
MKPIKINTNSRTIKTQQKGRGKVEKSKYYYLSKTVDTEDAAHEELNLYSDKKIREMLADAELNEYILPFNEWYSNFQKEMLKTIKLLFETVIEKYISASDEDIIAVKTYKAFISYDLSDLLSRFINYQLDDETQQKELTELITETYNKINDETIDDRTKYNIFKQFVLTIFDERYFSINALNFVKYGINYEKFKTFKFDFSKRPPTKINVSLTNGQLQFNQFVDEITPQLEAFNVYIKSHYDKIVEMLGKLYDKHNIDITIPAVNNAVKPSDNEYEFILKKDTKLYKGVTKANKSRLNLLNEQDKLFFWFAFDPFTTFNYTLPQTKISKINQLCDNVGYIGEFTINADYKLLNLLHPNIIKYLSDLIVQGEEHILTLINEILYIENGELGRKSIYAKDIEFMKWLCSKGYNGYIATTHAIKLHPEICLCDPLTKINPITEDDITPIHELLYFCDGKYSDIDFYTMPYYY